MAIDLFSIGRFTVHGYGLMIGLGFMAAVLVGSALAKKRGLSDGDFVNMAIFVLIIGFLGGKLLHVIVEFRAFLEDPLSVIGSEGFAVYGGIITGIVTIYVYCRIKKLVFLEYIDLFATVVPLNQALGRVGCLLAGCCYGKETHSSFALVFPENSCAPPHIPLIPTQPIMAAGNFIIFTVLLVLYIRSLPDTSKGGEREAKMRYIPGVLTSLYLLMYSAGRFIIEYFRDDPRGSVGPLSTSQFIAIFIFAAALILLVFILRSQKGEKTTAEENP
ncbi:MAG: prolipoprotein diacylglyceryl transferase [Lachnospiraceae bacterium]|nr:prolipoprotein diacylglyceryl transferase [Lachnospiraceae bacterium]